MVSIGFCKKPHGVGGDIKVQIDEAFQDDFLQAKVIFVEMEGKLVPYFVEDIKAGNDILLKLEDINSREAAVLLNGKEISLRETDLSPTEAEEENETLDYEVLEGFKIIDQELGIIGVVSEVIEYPQQMMAIVRYQDREVLIPLNEHLIKAIDEEKQAILMELPTGLLDL